MATSNVPARVVSTKFNSPSADIILVSKDNHSFAVHKANLARSPVFRDMFDFPAAPPTDNDATGDAEGNEEEAGRAMKRIRLEKEAGGVPELKTEESRAILEVALSFFYNDEDQYDPGELRGLSVTVEHRSVHQPSLVQVLRFFDKFDLRSGRTAVVMCLPLLFQKVDARTKNSFDERVEIIGIYFIAQFLGVRFHIQSALALLHQVLPASASHARQLRPPGKIREEIFKANALCFRNERSAE